MAPKPIVQNTLFYGDNLPILREYVPDGSIDLVYIDPPFNSKRTYNVLFKDESGTESEAQIAAFDDTWHWNLRAEETYRELITLEPPSGAMDQEAVTAGFYHSPGWNQDYPKIQILTVEELLQGARVQMPLEWGTFKHAERAKGGGAVQGKLEM